jgi:pimeloyl-ACP methyl ester carboxylesterase
VSWHDSGLPWGLALAAVCAVAAGWRALLVLLTFHLAGLGWPSPRLWLAEAGFMSRAYLAMTVEPLLRVFDGARRAGRGVEPDGRPRNGRGAARACSELPQPRLVLLHGWCCNGGVWRPLLRTWQRAGGLRPTVVTLTPVFGDIDRMAQHLERRIGATAGAREPMILVAHSMGGLVARRWLQLYGATRPVAALLTIGTPHAGSGVARWGPGRAAAQMRPGSDWLRRLDTASTMVPTVCAWSGVDNFVSPASSALRPGAEGIELPGRAHFGMLHEPAIVEALRRLVGLAPLPGGAAVAAAGARGI